MGQQEVAGYAKDGGKNVKMPDGKEKNVVPVSTAEYGACGWRAWLNGTTFTARNAKRLRFRSAIRRRRASGMATTNPLPMSEAGSGTSS